jgi:hypothetical protein
VRAAEVLARWDELAARFVRVAPRSSEAVAAQSSG